MSRLPFRFRGLRWRLTLSYVAVTLVALLTLVCVFVVVPGIVTIVAPQRPAALAQGLETLAPKLAPHLGQPVDRADLAAALPANTQSILLTEGITDNLRRNLAIVPGTNATLLVLAPNGAVLASLVPSGVRAESVAGMLGLPETHALLAAALGGTTDPSKLVASTSDGQTIAVAAITDAHGQVLGVLVLGADLHALFNPILWTMLLSLLFTLVPFTLLASVLGTLFGLLTARGLTRRLTGLTAVAESWGRGDFTVTARDPSSDELGQLARDLNRMAEQVQSLLQDRQQLAVVEERNRLARDLHDSVKQQIFATAMQVAAARAVVRSDPGAAEARLAEIERLVSEAQHELTGLIRELRPAALGDKGLVPALRELVADWSRATGIAAE
ncbi:MAG TPA: histidine kinase, partial [Ktedonobacterales bacterium]|nr:histidine kinase [Ktedonobacterales bacterium]